MSGGESPLPDWTRACGDPVIAARIRSEAADFVVDEELGFEPAGDGEHDLLKIEKTGANTDWVARRLAGHAGIRALDVGYSGLKDRRAVTTQWFSVRRPSGAGTDWTGFDAEGVRIVETARHNRKLKRGSHAANRFRIALRGTEFVSRKQDLLERVESISQHGVPNYFGPQRFGRDGGNIALAQRLFAGQRMRRHQRSIAISAARSMIFNAILDRRVRDRSWNRLVIGDRANLDGSNSVFSVDTMSAELVQRCAELDIHPTATLWGEDAPLTGADAACLESDTAAGLADLAEGLAGQRVRAASRPLRMRVDVMEIDIADDVARLSVRLKSGAFVTSVLREIGEIDDT